MSEPMIERVARAICAASGDSWDDEDLESNNWRFKASVAIGAMREPTDAMVDAAYGASPSDSEEINADDIIAIWPAMIDAALLEQQP